MSSVKSNSFLSMEIVLKLNETEARALKALTEYGSDAFIQTFYTKLGKSGMQNHESGLKSLFETIKTELPEHLKKIDKARSAF